MVEFQTEMMKSKSQPFKTTVPQTKTQNAPAAENKFQGRTSQTKENPYSKPAPIKCLRCVQNGHKSNEFPNRQQAHLMEGELEDDINVPAQENAEIEDILGDDGESLSCIMERILIVPKQSQISQRHAIFKTRCIIAGKVRELIIDKGCTENIISAKVVKLLGLQTTKHDNPYKISWVKKRVDAMITKFCQVTFSIGKNFVRDVNCNVLVMDVCHIILGRPWQYDIAVWYDCRANEYSFVWKGKKLHLLPMNSQSDKKKTEGMAFLNILGNQLMEEYKNSAQMFVLISVEFPNGSRKETKEIKQLLYEFSDLSQTDLPNALPPLRAIQHHIDLIPGATLPNLPHSHMSSKEQQILQKMVEDLLQKQLIRPSLRPCVVPAMIIPKKDGAWRLYVDSSAINKIMVKYRFPMPRFEDIHDRLYGSSIFSK